MGALCTPAYSKISMENFEVKHICSYIKRCLQVNDIYQKTKPKKTMKFDLQISPNKVVFLALLCKDENNNIQTTLYHKPRDEQTTFLHTKSEHPRISKEQHPVYSSLNKTIYNHRIR